MKKKGNSKIKQNIMTGSEKFWYSFFTLLIVKSLHWIFTLKFIGCDTDHYFYEVWWCGYELHQIVITLTTMVVWIFIILDDAIDSEKKEEIERPRRWLNPFFYINKLANKYLSD